MREHVATLPQARASQQPLSLVLLCLLIGFVVTQVGDLGAFRYVPLFAAVGLFFLLGKTVHLTQSLIYWTCFAFILAGAIVSAAVNLSLSAGYYVISMLATSVLYASFTSGMRYRHLLMFTIFGIGTLCLPIYDGAKLVSIYGNSNSMATVTFCMCYFVALVFYRNWILKLGLLAFLGLLIYLTQSRTHLGCWGLFLLFYVIQRIFRFTLNRLILGVMLVISIFYVSLVTNDEFDLLTLIEANSYESKGFKGVNGRDDLFAISTDLAREKPLGYGFGNSGIPIEERYGEALSPHNAYLKTWVEGGYLSLFGFILLTLAILYTSNSPLVVAYCGALVLRSLFESATPFTLSLISAMLILPYLFNEHHMYSEMERN